MRPLSLPILYINFRQRLMVSGMLGTASAAAA
jgi:hypothetical protein